MFFRPNDPLTCIQPTFDFLDSPVKDTPRGPKRKKSRSTMSEKSKSQVSEESDYVNADADPSQTENSGDESLGEVRQDIAELGVPTVDGSERLARPLPPAAVCAMCGNVHHGTCGMAERSENLVHYRQILFTEQTGESFEERVCPPSTLLLCSV